MDILLIIPGGLVALLLIVDLTRGLKWYVRCIGWSISLMLAIGIVALPQIRRMGPVELIATVGMCVLLPLMWSGGLAVTNYLLSKMR